MDAAKADKLRLYAATWKARANPTRPGFPVGELPEGTLHAMQYRWLGLGAEINLVGRTDLRRLWHLLAEQADLAQLIIEQGMTLPDPEAWRHPPQPEGWALMREADALAASLIPKPQPRMKPAKKETYDNSEFRFEGQDVELGDTGGDS